VMSFAASYIFFHRLRDQVASDLAQRLTQSKGKDLDAASEDGAIDSERDR